MLRNSATSWGSVARSLHWTMAVLITGQVALGMYAHDLALSPRKLDWLMWHKSIGICLLLLAVLRLLWAIGNITPQTAMESPRWQRRLARTSHIALYGLLLGIPLSGWLMNSAKNIPFELFRTIPWPQLINANEALGELLETVHAYGVWLLMILVGVHSSAALWHHFVRHDATLTNMLRGP